MAIIKCAECGKEISSTANVCPNCGKARKQTSGCAMIAAIMIGGGVLMSIIANIQTSHIEQQNAEAEHARIMALTPQQREYEQSQKNKAATKAAEKEKHSNDQYHRALIGALTLKKAARDPDSFNLISALVIDENNAVCYQYRARNGFGGMNIEQAVFSGKNDKIKTSSEDGFASAWNRECGNRSGYEKADLINTAMKIMTP
jgi:Na+-translocating ferredoxin:NAD+ oxidoreductase RnfG subunit